MTIPPRFVSEILQEEATRWDTTVADILEGCQMSHVVSARRAVVRRIHGRPSRPSTTVIGLWLNLHHSTVLRHLDKPDKHLQ